MKIFKKKFWVKLIASICIFLMLLNCGFVKSVYAESEVFGGELLGPIMNLLTGIADGVMDILHSTILGQNETLIKLDGTADSWWSQHGSSVWGWVIGIGIAILILVTAIPSGGISIGAGAGILANISGVCFIIKGVGLAALVGTASGVIAAKVIDASQMGDDIYLPVYTLSIQEIFANEIPLFDVNFFNPNKYSREEAIDRGDNTIEVDSSENDTGLLFDVTDAWDVLTGEAYEYEQIRSEAENMQDQTITVEEANGKAFKSIIDEVNAKLPSEQKITSDMKFKIYPREFRVTNETIATTWYWGTKPSIEHVTQTYKYVFGIIKSEESEEYLYLIHELNTSTEVVYTYNFLDASANTTTYTKLQNKETIGYEVIEEGATSTPLDQYEYQEVEVESTASQLSGVISKWYFTLRNLALLVLMLVLIFTGIKIVTSSTAGEKAKYKERLVDWLVAMCLVFVMHYIMVFAVELNEKFIELVDSADGEKDVIRDIVLTNENHISRVEGNEKLSQYLVPDEKLAEDGLKKYYSERGINKVEVLEWGTNYTGAMRIDQQLINGVTAKWIGYVICFIVLVIYTVIFSWTYLKRVLYMAFLTIIAPLVAMTYPIDKITDGKAQAFDAWLKEYIFNLLLQPFHLLLYMILVSSAYELAASNPLYAIVAIGFMTPAEKLLRRFFGFNKAQTPGLLGGAAGAALAMTGLQKMMGHGDKGKGGSSSGGGSGASADKNKIKYSSSDGVNPKGVVANSIEIPEVSAQSEGNNHAEEDDDEHSTGNHSGNLTGVQNAKQTPSKTAPIGRRVTQADINRAMSASEPESTDTQSKKRIKMPRGLRTVGTGIGSYFRGMGNKIYKRTQKGRPIRTLARGIAGLAGATAFGMAGLALGIASGDASKAFQYTTAGLAGGMGVGKGMAGRAVDALSVDSQKIKDEMEMEYYQEEYKRIKLEQEKIQMQHDDEYINYMRATLGVSRKEAKQILKGTGADCFDSGIRKAEDIAAIQQMSNEIVNSEMKIWLEENQERLNTLDDKKKEQLTEKAREEVEKEARDHTIAMKKFSDRTPDLTKLGAKKVESHRRQFKNEMQKEFFDRLRSQGIIEAEARQQSEQMAEEAANSIINGIIRFDDTKSKILKA